MRNQCTVKEYTEFFSNTERSITENVRQGLLILRVYFAEKTPLCFQDCKHESDQVEFFKQRILEREWETSILYEVNNRKNF